jgi:hypothetical protein
MAQSPFCLVSIVMTMVMVAIAVVFGLLGRGWLGHTRRGRRNSVIMQAPLVTHEFGGHLQRGAERKRHDA